MKKITLVLSGLLIGTFVMAQDSFLKDAALNPESVKAVQVAVDTTPSTLEIKPPTGKYLCAHCGLRMEEPGKCEKHNFTLVEKGHYYCPDDDGVTSDKPGKCPKCEKDMIEMKLYNHKE